MEKMTEKKMKFPFWVILVHVAGLWTSLAFSYNGYKKFMKINLEPLTRAIKDDIKGTFPWITLAFAILLIIFWLVTKRDKFLTLPQYAAIFAIHAIIINALFYYKGIHITIVINAGEILFIFFVVSFYLTKKVILLDLIRAERLLPPIVYQPLQRNMPEIRAYFKAKPSAPFIIAFMVMLMICAFLLIFKQEKGAEELANIAYFLLVIGVGIEVYQLIKYGERDEME